MSILPSSPNNAAGYSRFMSVLGLVMLLAGCGDSSDPRAAFEGGNYAEARALWQPLAEDGDAEAQNALGTMYYLGLGAGRDYPRARQWFERAAEQGHPRAQRNLGMLYMDGRGTDPDPLKAYMWFYAADKQGNENADAYINALVNKLTPNQQMQARRKAGQFIVNPSADYVPELEVPEIEPRMDDLRAAETGDPE